MASKPVPTKWAHLIFGAHVSTAKGLSASVEYAVSVGCQCLQLFAKSPRQWRGRPIDPEAAAAFLHTREDLAFGPVFTHTAYLINLATDNEDLRRTSVVALADELTRGAALNAAAVVTHLGNDPALDSIAAARRVADALLEARDIAGEDAATTRLLLENTAGAGKTFGSAFEELGAVIDFAGLPPSELGVCFDTCHGFARGMDVATTEGWDEVVAGFEHHVGIDRLGLIHANDCLFERGSRKDRHAWIGDGMIGMDGFCAMVRHKALAHVPVITEMPGDPPEKDAVNISRLRGCLLLDSPLG